MSADDEEGAAVWREAVRDSAETILATWVHQPRVSTLGPAFVAECTTPGCVGFFEQGDTAAEARAGVAEHIARVHWPEDA